MSDSGKSKKSRRHRGNRRKNKQKETVGSPARKESVSSDTTECSDRVDDIGQENTPTVDCENEVGQHASMGTSQNNDRINFIHTIDHSIEFIVPSTSIQKDSSCEELRNLNNDQNNLKTEIDYHKLKFDNYRVESPILERTCENQKVKKKLQNNKSKSLDNDDDLSIKIIDITDADYKSDDDKLNESNAVISEAESDVEWEVADDLPYESKDIKKIKGHLRVETIPLGKAEAEEITTLSPEDEVNLRNFLQTLNLSTSSSNSQKPPTLSETHSLETKEDKDSEVDVKQRRARKKAALEEYFLPQFINPRVLDVINEEGSTDSSENSKKSLIVSENRDLQNKYDDLDDDVFITEKKVKEPKDVFPKPKDYFACKKELKRQQECLLVGAKILETDVEGGCGDWTIEKIEEQRGVDIVYLDDSSSSTSEIDNGGDTDFVNEDERVTIRTPTIDFDSPLTDNKSDFPSYAMMNLETKEKKIDVNILHIDKKVEKNILEPPPSSPEAKVTSNDEINESLESLLVSAPIQASCNEVIIMANEFVDELPIVTEILKESKLSLEKVNSDKTLDFERAIHREESYINKDKYATSSEEERSDSSCKEYSRQDSSSSVCSSHSTSQSTAKYNPLNSSLTDIAAIVHDDLTSTSEVNQNEICDPVNNVPINSNNINGITNFAGFQKTDIKLLSTENSILQFYNPSSLRELCVFAVASLPRGKKVLEELALLYKSIDILTKKLAAEIQTKVLNANHEEMSLYPKPDLSEIKKIAMAQKPAMPQNSEHPVKMPPPINPRQSSFKHLHDDVKWVGLVSQNEPMLVACLSPSQKDQLERTKNKANDEAGELIDMHRKYVERRSYDESVPNSEKAPPTSNNIDDKIPVQASGGDVQSASPPGSTNRLLAIIRDPQLNPDSRQINSNDHNTPKSTFDFMETLRSFEDMNKRLAEEEKLNSWTKRSENLKENMEVKQSYSSNQSFKASVIKDNRSVNRGEKNIRISKFQPIDVPIRYTNQPFTRSTTEKHNLQDISKTYHSMGNLNANHMEDPKSKLRQFCNKRAFLLDDPIFDSFIDDFKKESSGTSFKQTDFIRRSSLPKDMHDSQFEYILQKEREIEEHIRQLEDLRKENRKSSGPKAPMLPDEKHKDDINMPVPKYHISKQRDVATIHSEIVKESNEHSIKIERPPLIVSAPSNGERFREQMYCEYMDKVAEREERKQQKVIKISNLPTSNSNSSQDITIKESINFPEHIRNDFKKNSNKMEEEFINKAKMRWDKLGFKDPETEDETDTEEKSKSEQNGSVCGERQKQPVVIEHKITVIEGDEQKDVKKLPNHLQEFVKFASDGDETEVVMIAPTFKAKASPTGVWSPSGGSQSRREETASATPSTAANSKPSTSTSGNLQSSSLSNGFIPGSGTTSFKNKSVSEIASQINSIQSSEISKKVISEKSSNSSVSSVVVPSAQSSAVNSSSHYSTIKVQSQSSAPVSGSTTSAPKPSAPAPPAPPISSVPPPPPLPPLPVWTPRSQPPSPARDRKEFKPVAFDSPTFARKELKEAKSKSVPPPPWETRLAGSQSAPAAPGLSGLAAPPPPPPPPPASALPRAQNPTITLLQKAREGQLPRGAAYLQYERDREPARDRRSPPRIDQNEIVYTLRREYCSDTESGGGRRRMEAAPRKYEGIGPTTKDGMPIVLRSEVKEGNQSKWYKKMYDTIHKSKFDDDYVTVRYKSRKAHPSGLHTGPRNTSQYAYFDPRSGYLSEPEGGARSAGAGWSSDAYDSDASACRAPPGARRHSALDRSKMSDKENDSEYLPNTAKFSTLASAKASQEVYKNQPGRIEDYVPGRSSVVDKEAKQWWDEVMDIFDGWLDENSPLPPYSTLLARAIQRSQLSNASVQHPSTINKQSISTSALSKSYMARALKESGYESDSTLVFRRREGEGALLSPREQRQAYREVQAGGEPPLHGFRKPAPDRPKDPDLAPIPPPKGIPISRDYNSESPRRYVESDVNIHYRIPVRQEPRPLVPEEELARRQADHMRRLYQEERRRKYLQELQDMNSRRHTDNFTPSQKSPISLNRYDNFGSTGTLSRSQQVARALHSFSGQGVRELSFKRGDLILVRRRIDTNWYEGEIDGQVGLFPYNYVEIIEYDTVSTPTQARPTEGRARAKFNFVAQTHLELGLKKGELVVLTRRVDENWYEGRLGGRKGIFPVSYVEVLAEPQPNRPDLTPISSSKPVASPAAHSIVGAAGAASLGSHHYTPQINNPALSNSPSSTAPLTLPSHGISNHHARPASATLPRASEPTPVNLNNHEPLFVDTNAEAVPYRAMYKYRPQNPDELELQEGDTVYVLEKCDDGWYVGSSQRSGRFGTFPGNYVEKI